MSKACYCKDKNTYSIDCCDGSLWAQGIGIIRKSQFYLKQENNDLILQEDNSKIIQGEFSLKNLGYFIKCTNLCNQIEIYLENDLPLVVKYDVANLGVIRLCLAPLPSA